MGSNPTLSEMHYNALGDLYALRDETGTLTYFRWDPTRRLNLLVESDTSLNPTAIHTHGRSDIRGVGTLVETDEILSNLVFDIRRRPA